MKSWYDEIQTDGYVFLRAYRSREFDLRPIESLGRVAELPGVRHIQELTPKKQSQSTPNTYSGQYGHAAFPLHTDFAHWTVPPRFVLLRCKAGFPDVATRVLDGRSVIGTVGEKLLFRALVRPRRPIAGRIPLLRLLSRTSSGIPMIRWDEEYLKPASSAGAEGLEILASALRASHPLEIALHEPGDTLIFDNWRMLHGRTAVGSEYSGRALQRAYLEKVH